MDLRRGGRQFSSRMPTRAGRHWSGGGWSRFAVGDGGLGSRATSRIAFVLKARPIHPRVSRTGLTMSQFVWRYHGRDSYSELSVCELVLFLVPYLLC